MKNYYQIPIKNTIAAAWKITNGVKGSIWAALGIIFLIGCGLQIFQMLLFILPPIMAISITVVAQIIFLLIQTGLFYLGIHRAFDLPVSYTSIFRTLNVELAWKVIVLYLLQILILLLPFLIEWVTFYYTIGAKIEPSIDQADPLLNTASHIVFTLSGIVFFMVYILSKIVMFYLVIKMMLSVAYVLDKKMTPWAAIKSSFIATKHNVWRLIAVMILQICIVLISIIPLGIGLIWTAPFSIVLYGLIYKRLLTQVD